VAHSSTSYPATWMNSIGSDGDVITLVKFLSVSLLLVNCWLTVGILPADSIPTVGRQTFRGAVLHFYQKLLAYMHQYAYVEI